MSLRLVMRIPLQTKLSIFEARNEYYSNWHLFARRWQHTRGLRLALASIHLALAIRSGASPHISIHSPRHWQHARGLRLALAFLCPGVGNTLGGCALQPDASNARGLHLTLLTLAGFYIINYTSSATSTSVQRILARVRHRQ
jgi:hypothetical protein